MPSFPLDHELRQLQRLAREDAREVPIQNAGRAVSDVQHVHAPDFLDDVLILVLPYLALHELAVLGRVDYKRLLSVSEEMRRRPLWLHLSDHGRLVRLLCSRTRAEQTSRVGPLLRLRSFPSVTLVVDLRDKRALPKWSLDRLRDPSEDGSGDELESAKLVVSGRVDVIVNAAQATRPKLSFKHMRFILNNFRPAVTRFSLGSSSCPCFLWTTIEMEIDVPVRNHIACAGVAPVLRIRPGRDGPANPSKHRLFLILDSLEDERRIGLGVGNWLRSHVFGQTWSEIEEWEPSHWPPWEVPSFLRTHVWVLSRAAGALHRAGVKPWLGPTVTIETRADWTATDEDRLANQVTAKVVSKPDDGRRVTESYRTQQPSQVSPALLDHRSTCGLRLTLRRPSGDVADPGLIARRAKSRGGGDAQAAANAHALASLRLFATALPYADRDLKDDACEAAYLTISSSKSNWWPTYLGSGDRPKQPLLIRARALVAEQDRAETWTTARSPTRDVDPKSVKPVFAQRIPHLIVEALFEVLDLGELAVCSRVCFGWLVLAAKEISLEHVSFDAEDTVHLHQLFCSRTKAQSKGKVADLLRLRRFASFTVIVNIGAKHDHLRHHVFRDRLRDEHRHESDNDYDLVRTGRLEVKLLYTDAYATESDGHIELSSDLCDVLSVFDPDLIHLQGIRTSVGQGVPRDSWPTLLNVSWACRVFEHDSLDTVVMTGFVPCEIMFDARPESAWSSARPMPRLVFVFEGAELVPDSDFADRLLVDLVENSYCYKAGTQSRVQDLDDSDPPFDVRFRSIDFWADDEAVERIKTAAQGTVLEDGGTDTWISFTSSTRVLQASPEDPLCRALGFSVPQTSTGPAIPTDITPAAGQGTTNNGSAQQTVGPGDNHAGGGLSQPATTDE